VSVVNPLGDHSEDQLVAEHSQHRVDNHYLTEMLRRHKVESAVLGRRIWWLNALLLIFTVAICALTVVVVLAELGVMKRRHEQATGPAWVLWITLPSPSEPTGFNRILEAFEKKAECDAAKKNLDTERREEFLRGKEGDPVPARRYHCLPDTVDPRGPKESK